MKTVIPTLQLWGNVVKFSHTIFALPFALAMFVIVASRYPVTVFQLLWILAALVAARTAAMSFNRLIDRKIDELNPRTKDRELPAGRIGVRSVMILLFCSSILFLFSSGALGLHCLILALPVLAVLFLYSWSKRFTSYSHLLLGLALALAPGGVWYALTAQFSYEPIVMMLAVLFWVAGFDVLYAIQDTNFDREHGLNSIPSRFGVSKARLLAFIFHCIAITLFNIQGVYTDLGWIYFFGLALFSIVLLSQHWIIQMRGLAEINHLFFSRNGAAAVIYFVAVLLDVTLRSV